MSVTRFALFCTLLATSAAHATTAPTMNFNVTLTVNPKCTITSSSINDMAFGTQDATATNLQAQTSLQVLCTKKTPYSIALTPLSTNSTTGAGTMASTSGTNNVSGAANTDTVAYQLRQASGMSGAVWGNVSGTGANVVSVPSTSSNGTASVSTIIYGTISSIGNVVPDSYKDIVTVTVSY